MPKFRSRFKFESGTREFPFLDRELKSKEQSQASSELMKTPGTSEQSPVIQLIR